MREGKKNQVDRMTTDAGQLRRKKLWYHGPTEAHKARWKCWKF